MRNSLLFCLGMLLSIQLADAKVWHVVARGTGNGTSWSSPMGSIKSALNSSASGDTVKVAAGTFAEQIVIKDGVSVLGGYDASTGARSEVGNTIIDGANLGTYVLIKYDAACSVPTYIDGLVFENAHNSKDYGCGYIRGNVYVQNCIIRRCEGSKIGGLYNDGGTIRDCIIELCVSGGDGAVRNNGGVVERCIFRGNQGKYGAAFRNENDGVVRNCLIHNNSATVSGWPNSGGAYNPSGMIVNCTFARNSGSQYAGLHSEGPVINSITWRNESETGFTDPANFVSGDNNPLASKNASDDGFDAPAYSAMRLSSSNMDEKGPHFVAPTAFAGIPSNAWEEAAMRAADFRLMSSSPLIDLGQSGYAPAEDLNGVSRPKGEGMDIGCYEYDALSAVVGVTGVAVQPDTLVIEVGSMGLAVAVVSPQNASDKRIVWNTDNHRVATVDSEGHVTGVAIGQTSVKAYTKDGGHTARTVVRVVAKPEVVVHPEVATADSLYKIADYTIPSYMPLWVAKEAARRDSSESNLAAMRAAIGMLVAKDYPYCVVTNVNGDPATQMGVAWFTNEGIRDGVVQIVESNEPATADFAKARTVEATCTTTKPLRYAVSLSGLIKATGMVPTTRYTYESHKALLTGLEPNTTYCYRVGTEGAWSYVMSFTTAPEGKEAFSFVYMTDSHLQDSVYVREARKCSETVARQAGDARFVMFPGDFVETGTSNNSEWEWEQWFEQALKPVLQRMPCAPTDGNHDDSPNYNYSYHFHTDNGFKETASVKPQFDGTTYSFVYGDVLFLVYSHQDYWRGQYSIANSKSAYLENDVARWMREQVAAHPETKWRIALVHKNLFCGSGHQKDEEAQLFRAIMCPVFEELHIDLVLQGHDHTYEVIGPVDNSTMTAIEGGVSGRERVSGGTSYNMTGWRGGTYTVDGGTMYFVGATCGNKRYSPYTKAEMESNYEYTKVADYYDLFTGCLGQPGSPAFTKVTVNSDSLVLSTYTANGAYEATLYDQIVIKREGSNHVELGVEEIVRNEPKEAVGKYLIGGQLLIARGERFYDLLGRPTEDPFRGAKSR